MKDTVRRVRVVNGAPVGFVLLLGYVGAAAYFWTQATSFWGHVWALIKAIVWPAILIYHGFSAFHV